MESVLHYMAKKKQMGKRPVGRPTRKDLGLEAMVPVFTRVEKSVVDAIVKEYGTVNAALRHLANGIRKAG